jgi:hypothetical protein
MKCLKNSKTGTIIRVPDQQANQMTGSTWKYVSKTEWKESNRSSKEEVVSEEPEKKKNQKQDLPDNGKKFVKTRKK